MDNLYNYFLHYNPYTKLWAGVKKDEVMKYLSGPMHPKEGACAIFSESEDLLKEHIQNMPKADIEQEHYSRFGWENQVNETKQHRQDTAGSADPDGEQSSQSTD